jgi:GNAT superfamily N-acetyltransferase
MSGPLLNPRKPLAFTIRPPRARESAAILDVLLSSFGGWPRVEIGVEPIEHLRWKLSSSPSAMDHHRISEIDGRVASILIAWIQPAKVRDRVVSNIQATDFAVHADFQRRGLAEEFSRRLLAEDQSSDVRFGVTSGHPAMRRMRHLNRGGPRRTGKIVHVHSLKRSEASLPATAAGSGCNVRAVDRFDERIDNLWREASMPFDFILERKQDYMNWRYADRRAGSFSILIAENGDRLEGFTVIGSTDRKGVIADLLALPGHRDVVEALVNDATSLLWARGATRVDCWLPAEHPYEEVLRRAGFAPHREKSLSATVNNDAIDLAFLADQSAAVHITAGDTDLV